MFDLTNKKVLLTGATGGIGRAVLEVLITAGAHIVISGTDSKELEDIVKQYGKDKIFSVICNLSDAAQVDQLYQQAEQLANQIDILICNAGITRDTLSIRMSDEMWNDVININLTSVFKLNREAMKKMIRQKSGRIINISSVVGYTGNAGQANYTAAKSGLLGMSKTFALESATRGVTVNCIAPGFIDTPMTKNLSTQAKEAILSRIPMNRMGTAKEVANAALFLASDESAYITGSTIHVNGGMFML
jgi:3-oxoacyl-[acyl-carrier protein] reductase